MTATAWPTYADGTNKTVHVTKFDLNGSAADGAAVEIVPVLYGVHRRGDFNLALTGNGFKASRYLTREEMAVLRDWITNALADRATA